jgi:REP element-mobilizing transposase RayT
MREQAFKGDIQGRRSIRLKGFDYTKQGTYFVTICTNDRNCIFGDIAEGRMVLNENGNIADYYWREIPKHFSNVALDKYVVMPDHVHGIIVIKPNDAPVVGARQCLAPTTWQHLDHAAESRFQHPDRKSLSSIIGSFKSIVSKSLNETFNIRGESIWQRNFYERIIKSQNELCTVRNYILCNPQNWKSDENYSTQ